MMEGEGSDENMSGNPESSDSSPEQGSGNGESYVMGDQRFKTAEDLYKSYKSLESKLGTVRDLEAKAQAYDEAAEALAAERGIAVTEAASLLREETHKLREKHAPKIEESKRTDELRMVRLELEKRDILDEVPEAKELLPQIMEYAKVTGKTLRDSLEKFRPIMDKISYSNKNMTAAPKTSFRSEGDDETPSSNREYQKKMEAYAQTRDPQQKSQLFNEALKAKLFKR